SMNGTIGLSGTGSPGTTFAPPSGTRIRLVVLIARETLPGALREPGLIRDDDRLRAVAQAELRENVRHVRCDCVFVDRERCRDVTVREALRDTLEDVELALVELCELGRCVSARRRAQSEFFDQPPRDRGREECVAVRDRPHRVDEQLRANVLEKKAGSSG